jgi:hypothetical protein
VVAFNYHAAAHFIRLRGLTITEVADAIGEDRANFTHVLAGRRRLKEHKIPVLSQVLGVSVLALLGPEHPEHAVIEVARAMGLTADDFAPPKATQ